MADIKLAAPAGADPPRRTNRNYANGSAFERKTMADLVLNGYKVIRAAGSHGKADIVALKMREVVLVQCKLTGPAGVRPAEWNALYGLAQSVGAVAVVAHKPRRGHIEYLRIIAPKETSADGGWSTRRRRLTELWAPDRIIEGNED